MLPLDWRRLAHSLGLHSRAISRSAKISFFLQEREIYQDSATGFKIFLQYQQTLGAKPARKPASRPSPHRSVPDVQGPGDDLRSRVMTHTLGPTKTTRRPTQAKRDRMSNHFEAWLHLTKKPRSLQKHLSLFWADLWLSGTKHAFE